MTTSTVAAWPSPAVRAGRAPGWSLALVCVAIYELTAVGRLHQLFPALAVIHPALVGAAGALLLALFDPASWRAFWLTLRIAPARWLLAFALWCALSVPGALWLGGALQAFGGFVKTVIMYFAIATAIRSPRDGERLALIYLVGATTYALVILARFSVGDSGRLSGLFYYDANDYAVLAVMAVPLALHFVTTPNRWWLRAIAGAALPVLVTSIVWTGSRGGFLALGTVVVLALISAGTIPLRWRLGGIAAIGLMLALVGTGRFWNRMTTILHPEEDYNGTAPEGRLQVWERGLGYMASHPVFGVGIGNFRTAEGTLSELSERQDWGAGVKWSAAHNSYVQVAAELGVPGAIMFLGLLATTVAAARVVERRRRPLGGATERYARLARALAISIAGFAIGATFLSLAYDDMIYTLLAIAAGLRRTPPGSGA